MLKIAKVGPRLGVRATCKVAAGGGGVMLHADASDSKLV